MRRLFQFWSKILQITICVVLANTPIATIRAIEVTTVSDTAESKNEA
jgi:hypothetical protein